MEAIPLVPGNDDKESDGDKFIFLNVAELSEKLLVKTADILLVHTDEDGSRNKDVYIKGELIKFTAMNVKFETLLHEAPDLVPVNKHTLVSVKTIHSHRHDCITLKNIFKGWNNLQITLNRNYRKEFYRRIGK